MIDRSTAPSTILAIFIAMALFLGSNTIAVADESSEESVPRQQVLDALLEAETDAEIESKHLVELAPDQSFDEHLKMQSSVEIEIGLRLYQEGDDYRAITALKRYRLLADNPSADHLSHLIIGDIYRRNEFPDLALSHFWDASRAEPDDIGAYHLGVQEMCVSMKAYSSCHPMLVELQETSDKNNQDALSGLAEYHRRFIEFVLRAPSPGENNFADPRLQRAAAELDGRNQLFEELPLKSPLAAGILSAIVPGAGQAYNGRWADAGLAIGTTGLFAGATAYTHFELESLPLTIASGIFAAGFYTGNIVNAVVDARRHNAVVFDDFFDALHRDLWPRLYLRIDGDKVEYDYRFDWPGHVDLDETDAEPPPVPGML